MKIAYEGKDYDFDFDRIRVKQAIKIEKHTGVQLTEWGEMLEQGASMLALQSLGWLILCDGKGAVDDADFEVAAFGEAFTAAMTAEAEAAAAIAAKEDAGPTPPPGQQNGSGGDPIPALSPHS